MNGEPQARPVRSALATDPVVERVQLDEGSWVDVVRCLLPGADELHDELHRSVAWQQGKG